MLDTVHQQGPANHFHVFLIQVPLKSPMSQDVLPPAPADVRIQKVLEEEPGTPSTEQKLERQEVSHLLIVY